jgi:hypothetical protein
MRQVPWQVTKLRPERQLLNGLKLSQAAKSRDPKQGYAIIFLTNRESVKIGLKKLTMFISQISALFYPVSLTDKAPWNTN